MVDRHPSKSIVNLGSASVDNVSSGWQSTMSSRKECNIYIMCNWHLIWSGIWGGCFLLLWSCVVRRPSVRRPSSLTFHIFDFYSETTERNSTKLDRKQDLNVLYQVCVFRADSKNEMTVLASDWLRHFRLLLWNRLTELNETWQEAIS